MKKNILLAALLVAFIFHSATAQRKDPSPFEMLKKTIPHAIPVAPNGDMIAFLSLLYNNEVLSDAFANDVVEAAHKDSIGLSFVYRGNMIEFTSTTKDPVGFNCQLWLTPQQGKGVCDIRYIYKDRQIFADDWLYQIGRNVRLSKTDTITDFCYHAELLAAILKSDLYLPHPLYDRIAYNFWTNPEYYPLFTQALAEAQLPMEGIGSILTVKNGKRMYCMNEFFHHEYPLPYDTDRTW